jgi:hypothetical protein
VFRVLRAILLDVPKTCTEENLATETARLLQLNALGCLATVLLEAAEAHAARGRLEPDLRDLLENRLLELLETPHVELVQAAAQATRASCLILQEASWRRLLDEARLRRLLERAMWLFNEGHIEAASALLAVTCATEARALAAAGGIEALCGLLERASSSPAHHCVLEPVLQALQALCKDSELALRVLAHATRPQTRLLALLRSESTGTRVRAAACLAELWRASRGAAGAEQEAPVLAVLLRALEAPAEPALRRLVPRVLARLIHLQPRLQRMACDADAVARLANRILEARPAAATAAAVAANSSGAATAIATTSTATSSTSSVPAANGSPLSPAEPLSLVDEVLETTCLECLSVLCWEHEEARRQALEARGLVTALQSLISSATSPLPSVEAALRLLRALSRSARPLRSQLLLLEPRLLGSLCRLAEQATSPQARLEAAAVLANLVLEFQPAKRAALEQGLARACLSLAADAGSPEARARGCALIASAAASADPACRQAMQRAGLGVRFLCGLLSDKAEPVRERAAQALRNLLAASVLQEQEGEQSTDEAQLLDEVVRALTSVLKQSTSAGVLVQALYALANLAATAPPHMHARLGDPALLEPLLQAVEHSSREARVASLAVFVNLAHAEAASTLVPSDQLSLKLAQLQMQTRLARLAERDPSAEVHDALRTLRCLRWT